MSLFWVESNDFGMIWTFWRILIFIEKWVLCERFASNFGKILNFLYLIKDFYTGVKIFDSKFALINSKILIKIKKF